MEKWLKRSLCRVLLQVCKVQWRMEKWATELAPGLQSAMENEEISHWACSRFAKCNEEWRNEPLSLLQVCKVQWRMEKWATELDKLVSWVEIKLKLLKGLKWNRSGQKENCSPDSETFQSLKPGLIYNFNFLTHWAKTALFIRVTSHFI